MSYTADHLYDLLPAAYRSRDEAMGKPLKAFLSVLAEQVGIVEENIDQLYDDQFIETCAEWVVPYIGDLIGDSALYNVATRVSSMRAEVANVIAYRRRKGTATMLEQLAGDVTEWDARVVEFFELIATTQYMNHCRPMNVYSPDLRQWEPRETLGSAFETTPHTVNVRSVSRLGGKYNIKNIGVFLWRLEAHSLHLATPFKLDDQRYLFNPLGISTHLFTNPESREDISQLAARTDVPTPMSRRFLAANFSRYYGTEENKSLCVYINGHAVADVRICNLSDSTSPGWLHVPTDAKDSVVIDPVLGRLALPPGMPASDRIQVTFHYGFSASIGGGEYSRAHPLSTVSDDVVPIVHGGSLQNALDAVRGGGIAEICDNASYRQPITIHVNAGARITLRASYEPYQYRPLITPEDEIIVTGQDGSEVLLDGLVISGNRLRVPLRINDAVNAEPNRLSHLTLRHCTLVPGLALGEDGAPLSPTEPSVVVESPGVRVTIDHCIVGGLRVSGDSVTSIADSIVDATDECRIAFAAPTHNDDAGGMLSIERSTVIGKTKAAELSLVSNAILQAKLFEADPWPSPVIAERRQSGCIRFSFLPHDALVPRRFKCQPDPADAADEVRVRPTFNSLRYGDPDYCQLRDGTALGIREGADDEAEMGAFHDLFQPQRERNLRMRLDEYLRFGLDAGIFHST
jgi:hypothetical protein